MAHLSRWMAAQDLEPSALDGVEVERFVQERRASGRTRLVAPRALDRLSAYLRVLGAVPPAGSREAATPAGVLVDRFAEYLLVRRGLNRSTVRNYCNDARAFLAEREAARGELALEELDSAAINEYLLRASARVSVCSAKVIVTGLRSLLRFLHVEGHDRSRSGRRGAVGGQAAAGVAGQGAGRLERRAAAGQLRSGHRGRATRLRDPAAAVAAGLRIGEVAALRLEDLDWRAGEVAVRGKGSRRERLPLPVDVGEAIVGWLRDGRPDCDSRFVFTRARAPDHGLHPAH